METTSPNGEGAVQILYRKTPLVYSEPLSQACGRRVYLKMENEQLGGSFKVRWRRRNVIAAS